MGVLSSLMGSRDGAGLYASSILALPSSPRAGTRPSSSRNAYTSPHYFHTVKISAVALIKMVHLSPRLAGSVLIVDNPRPLRRDIRDHGRHVRQDP